MGKGAESVGTHCRLGYTGLDTHRGDATENPPALENGGCGYEDPPLPSLEWAPWRCPGNVVHSIHELDKVVIISSFSPSLFHVLSFLK